MVGESSRCRNLESMVQDIQAKLCKLSLELLSDITDNFSDEREIGRGGFGVVYKGVLENADVVAVKKLVSMPGVNDVQFENEVYHLMMLKHKNIVRFLGYCFETRHLCILHNGRYCFAEMPEKLLCLEYLPNGSLDRHISDESCGLDWHKRYGIIRGICSGLHYLHEESQTNTPIIHLDLKPGNILLTNEMVPRIADFGLSRLFGEQQSHIYATNTGGSFGYMAPEYLHKGIITKKSDIFSLGVIVIEIITGRRDTPDSTGLSMPDFIENVLEKWRNRLEDSRCTSLEKSCQQIRRCIEMGLNCVQFDETNRPTVKEIIDSLKRQDDMNLHVINEEKLPADQVEQLARAPQESLNAGSPPRQNVPDENVPHRRTCAGCDDPIGHGRFLSCMGSVWHPECFRCFACIKPISEYEFSMRKDQPYHRSCYKECFHPKCDVCDNFIPTNRHGLIEYRAHPFWMQKYCPSHEDDGTPRCCSCERMEVLPRVIEYATLDDGRKLCFECRLNSIMDTPECQHVCMDIQEFFEGLNMKVEQQIPSLLVERQALNEALEAEKNGHHLPETRGLCLSEEQIVRTILKRPQIGRGNRILDVITGPYKLSRQCEVTAILILYGLPRLLTGSILAHEMMHAYLRLKGFRNLSIEVEEGICQVLSHLWLESEIIAGSSSNVASSSSAPTFKKGTMTEFEKKLGAFFKNQIETDSSEVYGGGFRAGYLAVQRYGLRTTLDQMKLTGSFPC
ncbi:protein DA1-related 1-like isoform X2 [Panicum virgatum]|uniref:Protein kinase domain-containing protein n=1 Tax=Panicum virgatum TaxID=38727 RepID=A0A8T0VAD4_PANVG|nr:protein DA1-related 1-like isoform X2 [Panicum virgatum]KAG2630466.1 hypothetical protein PVAP13_3KG564801 [Panicum virgatum]KAG2630468.1 hypothetical protein PVAP13_3KG564801 [Panicum virgatum]